MAVARRSANMNVMVEAAEKAGRALVRDFGEVENLQVSRKGPGDFVSAADLKSEKIIRAVLEKARPTYSLMLEEGGATKGTDKSFKWIVDPLDGTTNFLHGIPHWCVTIALEKDGEIIAGVTYDPIKDEMFTAEKGTGAFVNNKRMRVSKRTVLSEGLYILDNIKPDAAIGVARSQIEMQASTRVFGSCALDMAYTAAGRNDGCIMLTMNPWDIAAGCLMIKEAGGYVTSATGDKETKSYLYGKGLIGANPTLHGALLKTFKGGSKETKVKSAS